MLRTIVWAAIMLFSIAAPSLAATAAPLTDQSGERFAFESLRGQPLVLTFVSARCRSACPLVEAQIAQAVSSLAYRPFALRFLTVTLDPGHDSAVQMRRLAKSFNARPDRWIFATGNPSYIRTLMRRFGVKAQEDGHAGDPAHTTFVYLLDSRLHLERTLLPSADLAATLLESISR